MGKNMEYLKQRTREESKFPLIELEDKSGWYAVVDEMKLPFGVSYVLMYLKYKALGLTDWDLRFDIEKYQNERDEIEKAIFALASAAIHFIYVLPNGGYIHGTSKIIDRFLIDWETGTVNVLLTDSAEKAIRERGKIGTLDYYAKDIVSLEISDILRRSYNG